MSRWGWALIGSLLIHGGTAVGAALLGGMPQTPTMEVTAGEAQVALIFQPRREPSRPREGLELAPTQKTPGPTMTVAPEIEGVEAVAPRSLKNPPPRYPREAFRRGIQGVTTVRVAVSPEGWADTVTIERSSGSLILDEAAAQAVAHWTFSPATRGGRPVPGQIRIRIRFQIVTVGD